MEFNTEYDYIEYLSKRVADRAIKQIKKFMKDSREDISNNLSRSADLLAQIIVENARIADIRAQFLTLGDFINEASKNKKERIKDLEKFEQNLLLKMNRINDVMLEINDIKNQLILRKDRL